MYNSIRMHFRERPLRPWVAINLNYEFVGKLQGQNNLKIPFITGSSIPPPSPSHPPQLSRISILPEAENHVTSLQIISSLRLKQFFGQSLYKIAKEGSF